MYGAGFHAVKDYSHHDQISIKFLINDVTFARYSVFFSSKLIHVCECFIMSLLYINILYIGVLVQLFNPR